MKLDDDEAVQVAEAAANVGKHYNVPISPITQAWVGLGMTVGSIYAGKIAAIKFKREASKPTAQPRPAQPSANGASPPSNDLGLDMPHFAQPTKIQ